MQKKLVMGLLVLVMFALPVFASCAEEEVTTTPPTTPPTTQTTPPTEANWWDKFGEPEYGGTITYRTGSLSPTWDTLSPVGAEYELYFESLWMGDWTLDRNICSFQGFVPEEYHQGLLAESWEWTDPQTVIVQIREGIHWQDKPPVNGREFTAYDVEEHYDRMMGTGSGYTEPAMFYMSFIDTWEKVTATGRYTVEIKLKHPSALGFSNFLFAFSLNRIEAPEAVDMEGGTLTDWTKAVGTGPWMLTDYVEGSSITFSKNPTYWGIDERHPENQIPYADKLVILIMPDIATAKAALRTGQVDVLGGETTRALSWNDAQSLAETNPELEVVEVPSNVSCLTVRLDSEPFDDITVRKAMQMAINIPEIAEEYYHGAVDGIPGGIYHPSLKGYAYAYEDWPQELKDEYSYNPPRAKELLATAGYTEGFDTNVIASSNTDITLLQIFKSYLAEINVNMEINAMDDGTFMGMAMEGLYDQMVWWNIGNTSLWAYADYKSGSQRMNFGKANDPVYDQIANNIENAGDSAELRERVVEADKYAFYQHWFIVACPSPAYTVWQPYLKGYSGEDLHGTIEQIFARCWIGQNLKASLGY